MIKNDTQLSTARSRIRELKLELDQLYNQYDGTELELLANPIVDDIEKTTLEIGEYLALQNLDLENAVESVLDAPVQLENIGELLTKLRIAAGYTQHEFASTFGWKQPNLSRFESPNYSSQTLSKIVEYAGALGVWLHVTPSLSEAPIEETHTELRTVLEQKLLVAGIPRIVAFQAYGSGDSTDAWLTRESGASSSDTDIVASKRRDKVLEFA